MSGQAGPEPCAIINLLALRHNLKVVRTLCPDSKVMPVIKADAYGHGMLQVLDALHDADMLAVARISEALKIRQAGNRQSILVLEGFLEQSEIQVAIDNDLAVAIHQSRQIDMLENNEGLTGSLNIWLKIDTGRQRLGISPEDAEFSYQRLDALGVCNRLSLMTHFANADDMQSTSTLEQVAAFNEFADKHDAEKSLANSAGIIGWPESRQDMVRPGIMLYGASPMLGMTASDHELRPVMTLSSQLIAINDLKEGDCVGYGSTWRCPQAMPVGVVAIGYGDGYPRHAPTGTPVLVNGQRTQVVGRVSMDMITVDLRGIDTSEGDEVILWGEGLPAEEIAEAAGTITYELFCSVTARVTHKYVNES